MEIKRAHRIPIKFKLEKLSFSLLAGVGLFRLHPEIELAQSVSTGAGDLQDFSMESCPCVKFLRKVRQENVFLQQVYQRERTGLDHTSVNFLQSHPSKEWLFSLWSKETLRTEGGLYFLLYWRIFLLELKIIVINNNFLSFLIYPYLNKVELLSEYFHLLPCVSVTTRGNSNRIIAASYHFLYENSFRCITKGDSS